MAEILATADDACPDCTKGLAHAAKRAWPQFDWVELVEDERRVGRA